MIPFEDRSVYGESPQQGVHANTANSRFQGRYLYINYVAGSIDGAHVPQFDYPFGRIDLLSGKTEYFSDVIERSLLLTGYDVAQDGGSMFLWAIDTATNELVTGIYDIVGGTWDELPANYEFHRVCIY